MMLSSKQRECAESSTESVEAREVSPAASEPSEAHDEEKAHTIIEIYDYWKNFDIKNLKNELNEQMEAIAHNQIEYKTLSGKYAELSRGLVENPAVNALLDALHNEIDALSRRCNNNENSIVRLFKLITNVPDPLPAIDLAKVLNGNDIYEQIRRLQNENRELKQALQRYQEKLSQSKSQQGKHEDQEDKELITQLSSQVAKTSQLNLELSSRLTLTERELDAYKKILLDYQNELKSSKLTKAKPTRPIINNNNNNPQQTQLKDLLKVKSSANLDITYESNSEFDNDNEEGGEASWSPRSSCKSPAVVSELNTAEIAAKVRDLLSAHNIGQRVFAKTVLGLSQGTVSELLSKPKHWDKLTEKGRESYRKMYQWACSEQSIASVKAMSPRKGNKEGYLGYSGNGKEDSATEERIVQILNEAQRAMRGVKEQHAANDSGHHSSSSPSCSARSSLSPSLSPNDSKVSRKFDEESGDEDGEKSDEDEANRESDDESDVKSSVQQAAPKRFSDDACCPLDLTVKPTPRNFANPAHFTLATPPKKIKHEFDDSASFAAINNTNTNNNNNTNTSNSNNSAFARKQPIIKTEPKTLSSASPLRHIQSIADAYLHNANNFQRPASTPSPSLPSTNSNSNNNNNNIKTFKCVLPPVSQEQFDKYSVINTDDLVKRVKDLLSKFSISQRLFGECILNLSQGSVSDLLARPKPWVMLTQKGREPFIRMQMFIDDPDAVKKLMANQYKPPGAEKRDSSSGNISNSSNTTHNNNNNNNNSNNSTPPLMPKNILTTISTLNQALAKAEMAAAASVNENSNDSEQRQMQHQSQVNIIPYDISSLSAVGELNTEEVTNRVKETLLNNNIGQKLFGEAVLNLSQGTVSELLSKPKPWNTLSIKGREPYLRMYMWLNDAARLDKLSDWKEEKNCKNLMKRNTAESDGDQQKPKRRFIFSEEQKDQLMLAFKYDPYPAVNQMETLAQKLGLQTRTVINWFHNHRMRIRYKNNNANNNNNNHANASFQKSLTSSSNDAFASSSAANNLCSLITARSRFGQFAELGSKLDQFPFASLLGGFSLNQANQINGLNLNNTYASSKNGDGDESVAYDDEEDEEEDGDEEESGEMEIDDDEDDENTESNQELNDEINSMYLEANNNDSENIENESEANYLSEEATRMMKLSEKTAANKRRKPHNPQKLSLALNQMNNKQQQQKVKLSVQAPDESNDDEAL